MCSLKIILQCFQEICDDGIYDNTEERLNNVVTAVKKTQGGMFNVSFPMSFGYLCNVKYELFPRGASSYSGDTA